MKSSLHSLIPFLPLFSITFDCRLSQFSAATAISSHLSSRSSTLHSILAAWDPRYMAWGGLTENTASFIVSCWFPAAEMCLPHSCVATRARTYRERRLQHLLYYCVTSERTWRVPLLRVYGPSRTDVCFSASTVLALSKSATICIVRFAEESVRWRIK
jgi:hypothetical protein